MTDLLSIGASGINVYQRALSTVSNNIANLNTEGYSKQTTEISQNEPQAAGRGFIGTGAYFNRVARQYDSFLEQSLQRATADLESQQANAEFTTRLLDFLGDDDIGLVSALNKFFSSAQQMSTDPASSAYRSTMLRSSEELTTRINSLAEQLDDLGDQAYSAIEAETESLNALATQLGTVNSQLLKKKSEKDQPPALLDRRDQLLRDISEYAGISTKVNSQGLVTVSLAASTTKGLLVDDLTVRSLSVSRDVKDPDFVRYALNGEGGVEQLSSIGSGSISGYSNFLGSSLKQSKVALNDLVRIFADEVNAIQTAGLDLNGDLGQELFVIEPSVSVDQSNAKGALLIGTRALDGDVPEFDNTALTWSEASQRWSAVDPATGQIQTSDAEGRITLANLVVTITGAPQEGDRVLLSASNAPARGIRVGLETGSQIAAASLFRVTPSETNRGGAVSSVSFNAEGGLSGYDEIAATGSYTASERAPIGVIPAGQNEVVLELDPAASSGGSIQLMTRDGVHVLGNPSAVADFDTFIGQNDFFEADTTYSNTYLNAVSAETGSYKDYSIEYGAYADSAPITQLTPLVNFGFNDTSSTDFTGGYLEFTVQAPKSNTALALQTVTTASSVAGAVSVVGSDVFLGNGTTNTKIGEISYPYGTASSEEARMRVEFDATAVTPGNIDQIAKKLMLSDDRDLIGATHPYRGDLIVQAYDAAGDLQLNANIEFDSGNLVSQGAFDPDAVVEASIIRSDRIAGLSGSVGDLVIGTGEMALNGTTLGNLTIQQSGVEGYGALSALDVAAWLNAASVTNVTVSTSNEIRVDADSVVLAGPGLEINGAAVTSLNGGTQTVFADLADLMHSINAISSTTAVEAEIDATGALVLRNTNGLGANIQLDSVSGASTNALGRANGVVTGSFAIREEGAVSDTLLLSLEDGGLPADLNTLGLNTQIRIRGAIDEEIGVFLTGGAASVSSTLTDSGIGFADGLRGRVYEASITDEGNLQILDQSTDTVLVTRAYAGETEITYQGITMELRAPAEIGDVFVIDGNNTGPGQAFDAQGNNQNLMRIVDLEKNEIVNGLSITDAYLSIVGDVGNQATQAEISVEALSILKDQAIEARDRVSGVSLDQEAADLIRFQQAYQASAQVMQVASKLFDAILQVR